MERAFTTKRGEVLGEQTYCHMSVVMERVMADEREDGGRLYSRYREYSIHQKDEWKRVWW